MITWFDALLVTLLAAITVTGLRRGLAGGLWALLVVPIVWITGFVPLPWLAVLLALALGCLAAWASQRVFWGVPVQVWHLFVGGAGGFTVGLLVAALLTLSLPVKFLGSQGIFPSNDLPAPVYYATLDSLFVRHLSGAWSGSPALKRLVLPDQAR